MKKLFILLFLSVFWNQSQACAWWDPEYEYYNFFVQQNINSPMYEPFLLVYNSAYFESEAYLNQKNENIEDWQRYFGISYEQALNLVFKSSREEVQSLAKGNDPTDKNLSFADSKFRTKYKQALLYLAYAKYLEPFMAYKRSKGAEDYYWGFLPEKTVGELNYSKVISVLTKSWNAETDKDLKLRYGYQLVRFAHYYRKFKESKQFFNQYVESLNYKPIMYYYALDQKGGAERALGNFMQANYDFFQFFTHTQNNKTVAYTSMRITQDLDFQKMLKKPITEEQRFDLYMLMGYSSFNNPIVEMEKIIQLSPDAVQAKVLMARAVNQLERDILPLTYYCVGDSDQYEVGDECLTSLKDKRLPLILNPLILEFLNSCLAISTEQTRNAKEKDFWYLTTAYLHFLNKDYQKSNEYLEVVNSNNPKFADQKRLFQMLLEIVSQNIVDSQFEKTLMSRYKSLFTSNEKQKTEDGYATQNSTLNFVLDILANRYFLQKDYAKSFLLLNEVTALEYNPDLNLLDEIEALYHKKNKNDFEHFLMSRIKKTFHVPVDLKNEVSYNFESWTANMRGSIALLKADFSTALAYFKKVDTKFSLRGGAVYYDPSGNSKFKKGVYNGFSNISNAVFGFNKIECFECPESRVMQTDFLGEFPFIKEKMNKRELTEALIEFEKLSKKTDELASKANYLMANFFFNTTTIGYFRELLTFDVNNSYGPKFRTEGSFEPNKNVFYIKDYYSNPNYKDDFQLSIQYAEAALSKTVSEELRAQILFTASKGEQGIFFQNIWSHPIIQQSFGGWPDFNAPEIISIKVNDYRKYFKQLKNYSSTAFYSEVKSNCKYFNYYSNHF